MIKTFYFYKNLPNNYVSLHKGNCRFCNNGNGVQNNVLGNYNGLWSEAFDSYNDALNEANAVAILMPRLRTIVKNCKRCKPQI